MLAKVFVHGVCNFIVILLISAGLHRVIQTYFYVSVLTVPVSALVAFIQFRILNKNGNFENRQITNLVLTLFITSTSLLSFSFHSTVPLNVDRSFSVWMINKIATDPKMRDFSALESNASKFFSPKNGEIQRRLDEQIALGNVKIINNQVELTSSGQRIWKLNRFLARLLNLNKNYAG